MVYPGKKSALIICLTMLIAILTGCASHKEAAVTAPEARRIVNVSTSENPESINVFIEGNQSLIYSAVKQVSPRGVLLSFPDTAMDNLEPVYTPPDNEIISSIKMSEIGPAEATRSSIFIALKEDTPYKMIRREAGLQISFPKPQTESAEKITEPEITSTSMPTATRLETVTATALDNKLVVNIIADGAIKDYKSFTLDSPPRIVFDMFNIKSPYEGEQTIAVKSKWVNRVRHFGHPDKVRLVLDTNEDYLSKYSAATTENGLTILVGISSAVQSDSD
jgi:hypothetical protein